ncbi:hypothetical protein BKA70DRAFT_362154 [Coprinopsis sp. MPI-PUGE-AT-0042]|nr:hypothetical protein BKA70DRAFT_362154 [Coprinopsis sp. MPI-PUGE-AT-0042]
MWSLICPWLTIMTPKEPGAPKSQNFRALRTDHGWAFEHVQTQKYLGIPYTVVHPDAPIQVSTVEEPLTWMIIPHHGNEKKFKICLPFTSQVLYPESGSVSMPVCLRENSEAGWTWWGFELYSEPFSATLQASFERHEKSEECMPGPKDEPMKSDSTLNRMEELSLTGAPVAAPVINEAYSNTGAESIASSITGVSEGIKTEQTAGFATGMDL